MEKSEEEQTRVPEVTSPALNETDPNLVTIQVGKRLTIVAKKLNGKESRKAGFMARLNDAMDAATVKSIFAVRKVNGEVFAEPKNDGDIDRVLSRFTDQELDAYLLFYREATADPDLEDQVKKLLATKEPSSP